MRRRQASRDAAVYAPAAGAFYDLARVLPSAGGGGAEFQTTQLAAGLAAAGLRVAHIVYPLSEPAPCPEGLEVVQRRPYLGRGGPAAKLREAVAIWRSLDQADASVYLLRGYGLHLIVGALFGRLRRRSVLISGSNDIDFRPALRSGSRAGASLYRRAIGSAELLVVQTDQQRSIAAEEYPGRPIELIRSFAEVAEVSTEPPEAFLWIGRLVAYKRPLSLIELAEALPEQHFWMVCVETSETTDDLRRAVREAAARLENVELLEPRPRAEMLTLIERATAVILTSEWEGMPNIFLEAWMRGIPVASLGFDPDGRIAEWGSGIAAAENFDSFAAGVERLAEDADFRAETGARGRSYVLAEHSPEVISARWASAVRGLLPS